MRTSSRVRAAACAASMVMLGLMWAPALPALAQTSPAAESSIYPSEAIVSYDVTAQVQANTDMIITETIVYDPGTEEVHHGILRDIPTRDKLPDGNLRVYDVKILSVSRDGGEVQYSQDTSRDMISLKIGDENIPIEGLHSFVISYQVGGALDLLDASAITDKTPPAITAGDIELYWDFIGDQWSFPIHQASATITGPTPALAALCFYGPAGSTTACPVQENVGADSATVMTADLQNGGSLTGAIGWAPGGFTQMPKATIIADPAVADAARLRSMLPFILIIAAIALVAPIAIAFTRRRSSAGVVLAATPVRYQPPDGVRPAQMQAGIDGTVNPRGYTATLLDLAARGHITLKEEQGRAFHREGLEMGWTGAGKDTLSDWETALLAAMFKGNMATVIGSYDPALTAATAMLSSQLRVEALTSGRYNPEGDKPDRPYTAVAIAGAALIAIGFACSVVIEGAGLTFGVLFALTGIGLVIGGIAGRIITPRRQTKVSAAFLGQVAGFKRLLNSDSADARRDFALKIGLPPEAIFATFLPFAVVLGLENTWVSNFPDVTPEQLQAYGIYAGSMYAMSSWSNNMASNITASTTAPTSSSGGSGLGGGGSSGGGGGGGGGGSF